MRLVYYLPSLEASGGLERIITFKANYFAEQGNEVTIITSELGDRKPYFPLSPQVRHIDLGVAFDYPYSQSRLIKLLNIHSVIIVSEKGLPKYYGNSVRILPYLLYDGN